ncbi:nickel pincer cofactor biosynthesis protein LarB [Streptomyces sp. NPDC047028]|uniref:nickel pincer cofactor biosynthesis protein LarB n=1 Tax=Streptomyces sp. NPDC047028 TaxID=3155793 RepID=UPI00340EA4CE
MPAVSLEYGDGHVDVDLPENSVVVRAGRAHHEPPPLADPLGATRDAIRAPLGCPPLGEQVGPGSTVTIAFPDRVKGGAHATAHRRVALRVLLEELTHAGVALGDITLVCAIGLHRKNHRAEFEAYLGAENLARLRPGQVVNHDAEDPDGIVTLDDSSLGDVVQMNRRLVESDLTVLIGHTAGNPYGGFSGGYKMPATGLTTWRSIRGHHSPSSLYREDFLPISTHSHFRHQLASIGKRMEWAMPRPFFAVDAVLDSESRQLGVYAGAISAVEGAAWPLATERTQVTLPGPPADILLLGMPRDFHYGPGMGSNPVLMMQAIGSSIARAKNALVPRPVVVAAAVCDGWFNEREFPSYRAAYEGLQTVHHPSDMVRLEEELCTDHEWIDPVPPAPRLPSLPRVLDAVRRRADPHVGRRRLHRRRAQTRIRPRYGRHTGRVRRARARRGPRTRRPGRPRPRRTRTVQARLPRVGGRTMTGNAHEAVPDGGAPALDLGYARLDLDRRRRTGDPEVVYGQGKTPEQVTGALRALAAHHADRAVLATRLDAAALARVEAELPDAVLDREARCARLGPLPEPHGRVVVVSAGTADGPAAVHGAGVEVIRDVGVAGLHRLLAVTDRLEAADALVVVAGMEGALPSVVGGLTGVPLVAVPTSTGYGSGAGGKAALLAMLNSCAPGIVVVNVDNGYGAGVHAARVARRAAGSRR